MQCLAPTCHLSSLNYHCIADVGLPIHLIGEVSAGANKKTSVGLLVFNPLFLR
jgi:hypothetical protein